MRFETRESITEYVRQSYQQQRSPGQIGGTPRLPLAVAEPDVLIEEAVRLSEPEGVTDAVLRLVVPVGQERFEKGMWRLRESGRIQSQSEMVSDRALRMRRQTVWHLSA